MTLLRGLLSNNGLNSSRSNRKGWPQKTLHTSSTEVHTTAVAALDEEHDGEDEEEQNDADQLHVLATIPTKSSLTFPSSMHPKGSSPLKSLGPSGTRDSPQGSRPAATSQDKQTQFCKLCQKSGHWTSACDKLALAAQVIAEQQNKTPQAVPLQAALCLTYGDEDIYILKRRSIVTDCCLLQEDL